MFVAQETAMPELTDEELLQRITELRRGVADGTIPLWTGDESLSAYLDRARSARR
jgi:hypothetical protein